MLLWAKPHYFCEIQFLFNTFGELFYFLTCSFLKKIVVEISDMLWNFPHDNYHYQHKKKPSSFNIPCTPPPLEGGWGIWTFPRWWRMWTRTAFPLNECVLSSNVEVYKCRKFTFVSRWLRRRGPQELHSC